MKVKVRNKKSRKCLYHQCKLRSPITPVFIKDSATRLACSMGFSGMGDPMVWPPSLSQVLEWPRLTKYMHSQANNFRKPWRMKFVLAHPVRFISKEYGSGFFFHVKIETFHSNLRNNTELENTLTSCKKLLVTLMVCIDTLSTSVFVALFIFGRPKGRLCSLFRLMHPKNFGMAPSVNLP